MKDGAKPREHDRVEREEAVSMDAEGEKREREARAESAGQASSQSERFIAKARELGLDEREEAFDAALTKVARHKPTEMLVPAKAPKGV